jgi:low affinity Fe/Cu permease
MRLATASTLTAPEELSGRACGCYAMGPATRVFTRFATAVSKWTGRPGVFIGCCVLVIAWALSGPLFGFSDTWQLMINTTTTIITFLMVFLIQNTQNRDNAAIQAKLDEIIRTSDSDNKFIGIEHLSDEELDEILDEVEKSADKLHAERRKRENKPARKSTAPKRA